MSQEPLALPSPSRKPLRAAVLAGIAMLGFAWLAYYATGRMARTGASAGGEPASASANATNGAADRNAGDAGSDADSGGLVAPAPSLPKSKTRPATEEKSKPPEVAVAAPAANAATAPAKPPKPPVIPAIFAPIGEQFVPAKDAVLEQRQAARPPLPAGNAAPRVFAGHGGQVTAVALSTDRRFALSSCADKQIRLWDVASGKELARYFSEPANALVFSEDARWFVAAGNQGIRAWDTDAGLARWTFKGGFTTVAHDAARHTLLASTSRGDLLEWTDAGKPAHQYHPLQTPLLAVRRLPEANGETLIKLADATESHWFKLPDEKVVRHNNLHNLLNQYRARVAEISPDGAWIASAGGAPAGAAQKPAAKGKKPVENDAFLPFSIVLMHEDGPARKLKTMIGHSGSVTSLAFAQDSDRLLSGSADGTLRVWSAAAGASRKELSGHKGQVNCVRISRDGRWGLSGGADGTMRLWDLESGAEIDEPVQPDDLWVERLVWIWKTRWRVYYSLFDEAVCIADPQDPTKIRKLKFHRGPLRWLEASPKEDRAISQDDTGRIVVWEFESGRPLLTIDDLTGPPPLRAFSRDEKQIVLFSSSGEIRTFDLATGKLLLRTEGGAGSFSDFTLSSDGSLFAARDPARLVRVWKLSNAELLTTIEMEIPQGQRLAFSPGNEALLVGDGKTTSKAWTVRGGTQVVSIPATWHTVWVTQTPVSRIGGGSGYGGGRTTTTTTIRTIIIRGRGR